MSFLEHEPSEFYDELFDENGNGREHAIPLIERLNSISPKSLLLRQKAAEAAFFRLGITFNVYGEKDGAEKIFPFDVIPRLISGKEWKNVEKGLRQRTQALNLFVADIYDKKKILKDKVIPEELVMNADTYRPQCEGLKPKDGTWINICGSDLIRDKDGSFYVLEDNLRVPSGVSYVIENRAILKKVLPTAFSSTDVKPVEDYGDHLRATLKDAAFCLDPAIVLLTPGPFNSAYFEHAFLAQQMGVNLVQASDLVVRDECVLMRTTGGFEKVDVIYRRVDDDFFDPEVFREDSLLGVPGVMRALRAGNVAVANVPGTGIADDKGIYPYVPAMIKYYLGQDPIIPNVETYSPTNPKQKDYILKNMKKLVVKATNLSGGYGMIIGNKATDEEIDVFCKKVEEEPRNYVAQPIISLSRCPTIQAGKTTGCHVDFRPFILTGKSIYVTPGGLTRVALKKGSLVVNSSQGGGCKDTWVTNS